MTLIAWVGFAGAWLLVAGPLYQGALELLEQEIDRTGFEAVYQGLPPPEMPSAWWWLMPPVMFARRRRLNEAYRRQVREQLTPQQREQFTGFMQKATGWFVVAAGASLLAVKETWELAEHLEWPVWVFVAVLTVMFVLVLTNTAYGVTRKQADA